MQIVRYVGLCVLLLGAFPSLRLYFYLTDVPCPNKTVLEMVPPTETPPPFKGSLVMVGGGNIPDSVFEAFVKRAGGKLVVIPTASDSADKQPAATTIDAWQKRGIADVTVLHTHYRSEANDSAFVEPLRHATAVWMTGGDQKRLIDAYKDTLVEKELHALLDRGGTIGGTSAGAVVTAKLMVLKSNDADHLAEGFGFLPNAVVDPHFLKRNRIDRLHEILTRYPGRFGIGIDEGTAVIVDQDSISVVGSSVVMLCHRGTPERPASTRVMNPGAGASLTADANDAMRRMSESLEKPLDSRK
jgi:cyanophycinase